MNDSTGAKNKLKHILADGKAILPYQGLKLVLDGVVFEYIYSTQQVEDKKGNEACSVVKVNYGGVSFLITGETYRRRQNKNLLQQKLS